VIHSDDFDSVCYRHQDAPEAEDEDAGDGANEVEVKEHKGSLSYSTMAVEAVLALNERHGSSLVAIRKYIQTNFPVKHCQTASFNNLTLKGVTKAVAGGELEKIKHSFKISWQEKERRRIRERQLVKKEKKKEFKEVRWPGVWCLVVIVCFAVFTSV
jgi:hypothetical protein